MSSRKMSDTELRYWRLSATVQELCHASDADIAKDKLLSDFVDRVAKAMIMQQDSRAEQKEIDMRAAILKQVGIPVIGPKGK